MKAAKAVVFCCAGLASVEAGKPQKNPPPTPPPTGTPSGIQCPDPTDGLVDTGFAGGVVELGVSSAGRLCTLVEVSPTNGIKPVGRSYDNYGWESAPGEYASLSYDCTAGSSCLVELPNLTSGYKYSFASYEHSLSQKDKTARFLEQVTFGPTRSEIAGTGSNFAAWVKNQQGLPVSSHRQFFREQVVHHHESTLIPSLVTGPCDEGTRYRRYAFSEKDDNRMVQIETVGNDKILSVGGQRRTIVSGLIQQGGSSNPDTSALPFDDGFYEICRRPVDGIGGRIRFLRDGSCASYMYFGGVKGNPQVLFNQVHSPSFPVIDIEGHTTEFGSDFYDGQTQEVYINSPVTDSKCKSLPSWSESPEIAAVGFTSADGLYWLHSPSFNLIGNEVSTPRADGGKLAVELTKDAPNSQYRTICSNAPRTFLNEDTCAISYDACVQKDVGDKEFVLNVNTFKELYDGSGGLGGDETLYVYSVDNLRLTKQDEKPCTTGARTRWRRIPDNPCTTEVQAATNDAIAELIIGVDDSNQDVRDIIFPSSSQCAGVDEGRLGFKVQANDQCWMHTHADNLQVFDFTEWTYLDTHPGNSDERNPIKEFAENGTYTLLFPEWHDMGRWKRKKEEYNFPNLGRLGDSVFLQKLPTEVILDYANAFGMSGVVAEGGAVTVCGSPYETANDLTRFGHIRRGGFDMSTWKNRTTSTSDFRSQRVTTWMELALSAPDQFRGRAAWALYQLLAVSPDAIEYEDKTEHFVTYYDIFSRNAFNNYRTVLREVSYSPMMGEMLTYRNSQSTGYKWTQSKKLEYPDENFAREIMQLFSIGLYKLNDDGTRKTENGVAIRSYTNDEITEYARAWTGFERNAMRGNLEKRTSGSNSQNDNQVDPMNIRIDYRDHLPKMGVDQKYVGEGYPLCSDLPDQHFLKTGATFLLWGADSNPERHEDPSTWSGSAAKRLSLSADSPLAKALCAKVGNGKKAQCTFPTKVVLDQDLVCDGLECSIDAPRTFEASGGMFYEYIRPPCVHQAFYSDAKLISRRSTSNGRHMCGDPRMESASTTCCDSANDAWSSRENVEVFSGERVTFSKASDRCQGKLCALPSLDNAECGNPNIGGCDNDGVEYWSATNCRLQAKIDREGKVAIVHDPVGIEDTSVESMVQKDTKMFFRVEWRDETVLNTLLQNYDDPQTCQSTMGCAINALDGICMCEVASVTDMEAFSNDELVVNTPIEELLSRLTIGALQPTIAGVQVKEGVIKYTGATPEDTVFEIVDRNGIKHYRKNVKSDVSVGNGALSFRNPVHFISVSDPESRDAIYETEAVLDHYFHHPNTPPFLAIRFAKRFGISNPSPGFVSRIATAFRTGRYESDSYSFGTNEYGDLAATFASVVLDREARNVVLDADPMHGSLQEPFLKIVRIMRSLEFESAQLNPFVYIHTNLQDSIGQQPHRIPSVFSYFEPGFQPAGRVQEAGLTAPETQVLTGPNSINLMNAILSFLRYGLDRCKEGFGFGGGNCRDSDIGNNDRAEGNATLVPDETMSVRDNINELATLLTSGRLSNESRVAAEEAYQETVDFGKSTIEAFINAEQVITSTPEFHTNGLAKQTAEARGTPEPPVSSSESYKAVVYLMLPGGYDSYNMLVPHECNVPNTAGQTVREQYDQERGAMAFEDDERSLIITAEDQPCTTFALHDELSLFHQLYKNKTLSFFANTGVINENGMNKQNYRDKTETQLFAHDAMQREGKKVDPYDSAPGTGVLGRAAGVLSADRNVNTLTIDNPSIAVDGIPGVAPAPLIVSRYGARSFNPGSNDQSYLNLTEYIERVNKKTTTQSNIYGETWSNGFMTGIQDTQNLQQYLANVDLSTDIWYNNGNQNTVGGSELWWKFSTLYKLIESRTDRGSDLDIFYASFGGWDHHYKMKDNIRPKFQALNHGLDMFVRQLQLANLWDDVTIVVVSDFARTITPNSGVGSDHAWGGHYPIMGGSVKGGLIHGKYPDDITPNGSLNIGRGRIIPTLSWDAVWNGVIEHLGVTTTAGLDECLPNRGRTLDAGFNLFTAADLFNVTAPAPALGDNIFEYEGRLRGRRA